MTLLLNSDQVEKALTPEISIQATEAIYRGLAEGTAYNRPRSQVYLPAESKNHRGLHCRFRSEVGGIRGTCVWASRGTCDMSGPSLTGGKKRRRILPVATGHRHGGLVILCDIERIEPIAIMPDGITQKMRVAALSSLAAKYLAPAKPKALGLF